jgi:hypothetical protein
MKVALEPDLEALIDAWRRQRCLTRAEAVRRLIMAGLQRTNFVLVLDRRSGTAVLAVLDHLRIVRRRSNRCVSQVMQLHHLAGGVYDSPLIFHQRNRSNVRALRLGG